MVKTWNFNSDSKSNWPWISLLLPGKNLKIHGILCHKRSGNPASVLTHFEIFVTKICMKVPGIWHKKTWKKLEFRTKNHEKTWNLVFGKKVGTLYMYIYLLSSNSLHSILESVLCKKWSNIDWNYMLRESGCDSSISVGPRIFQSIAVK